MRLILLLVTLMAISGARMLRAREDSTRSPASGHQCRIYTDAHEIPHLRAPDALGAFACLGYVHGLERPWQMDYLRRIAQGRTAEILGFASIKTDFLMRLVGLQEKAKELAAGLSPEVRAQLRAYSEGVNRGMKDALARLEGPDRRGVYEFADFGYRPEPWTPEDSVSVLLVKSFDQTRRTFEEKISEVTRQVRFGAGARMLYSEDGLPWDTSILKPGEYRRAASAPSAPGPESGALHSFRQDPIPEDAPAPETGSNSWALAPSRSRTGKAWIANDPHLSASRPAFWFLAHLSSEDGLELAGATVPGLPFFAAGASRQVAWAVTNAYMDVSEVAFVRDEELRDRQVERPWIWVRWWKLKFPVFFKTFSRTAQGDPILPLPSPEGTKLVLRWNGHKLEASDLELLLAMPRSRSARELDTNLARSGIPSFNYVFADRDGNIGYRTVGRVAWREKDSPYGVPELSLASWSPSVFRSAQQMPSVFNPARGFVATANNRQWPSNSAEPAGRFHRRGLRAYRIEELLNSSPKHDFESLKALQCDSQAVEARWMLPALLSTLPKELPETEARAVEDLRGWARSGFGMRIDCGPCAVYRTWLARTYQKEKLELGILYRFLTDPESRKPAPPSLARTLRESFTFAVSNAGSRSWGELHRASFPHYAGPAYRPVDSIPTPGDEFSVNLGSGPWTGERFEHATAPSMRLIVELADPFPRIGIMLAGSNRDHESPQLGAASSPWSRWSRCEYVPFEFPIDWNQATAETVAF